MGVDIIRQLLVPLLSVTWHFLSFYRSVQYQSVRWCCRVVGNLTMELHSTKLSARQLLPSRIVHRIGVVLYFTDLVDLLRVYNGNNN